MKHSDPHADSLAEFCNETGIDVSREVLATMLQYLDAVLVANETTNLTRITDRSQAVRLHLADSLCAIPEVLSAPAGRICDIGTGGGFPGVPIALAAGRECMLLDSVRKKAEIVAGILRELRLDQLIGVSSDRAEQHARNRREQYAVVTARAVAPLASLVELAAPLMFEGGELVALKGSPDPAELDAGLAAARVAGLTLRSNRDFILPGGDEQRCIIVFRKVKGSKVTLPRREGLAQHSPLG